KPILVEPVESLYWLDEGDPLRLDCGIQKRSPLGTVYWERNGSPLGEKTPVDVLIEKQGDVLHFQSLRPEHDGVYQCVVAVDGFTEKFANKNITVRVKGE
ncbi:unnamed protein product, partial [Protopolystoma xenopodis]